LKKMSADYPQPTTQPTAQNLAAAGARSISPERVRGALAERPFEPHPLFVNGHAQTLVAYAWPRRFQLRAHRLDEERVFAIEAGVQLLAHCRWQNEPRTASTVVLVHGLEGSSSSIYILGTAAKAFRAGFNVVRLNLRNCGATEHLTPTLYNSGMSGDLNAVLNDLIERDQLQRIFIVGFSMSANMALKLAGEAPNQLPAQLSGICAVSPPVDLATSAVALEARANWLYQQSFMRSLRRRMRHKQKLFPDLYDTTDIHLVRTVREFDDRYTSIHGGYENAEDYYARASALPLIRHIQIPTLLIHAQDDPFIPFHSFRDPSLATNPSVIFIAPEHGGHVGFVAADTHGEDRFWAENRIVQFCKLIDDGRAR
jgi:predicted alpha/beta-fold hydrolase